MGDYFLMISSIVNPCDLPTTRMDSALSWSRYSDRLLLPDSHEECNEPWVVDIGDVRLLVDDVSDRADWFGIWPNL